MKALISKSIWNAPPTVAILWAMKPDLHIRRANEPQWVAPPFSLFICRAASINKFWKECFDFFTLLQSIATVVEAGDNMLINENIEQKKID